MKLNINDFKWTRSPKDFQINEEGIIIITNPHTDLWQKTYYHFINDNAPVFQIESEEKYFSFVVKTTFESKRRFDLYLCNTCYRCRECGHPKEHY